MATVTLHHIHNQGLSKRLAHTVNGISQNVTSNLRIIVRERTRQLNVILKKLSSRNVTNYLLHASYEGFKQNLQGSDINIDYLLLTARTNFATVQHMAAASLGLMNAVGRKIILSLNRPNH